ncbi:hypothetical protein ACEE_05495 [Actinobacillus equuli subsp. equuli]|nr:hypothetical protein ACEE_05495 [Actinobacillus equuli subsp. equuli]
MLFTRLLTYKKIQFFANKKIVWLINQQKDHNPYINEAVRFYWIFAKIPLYLTASFYIFKIF